MLRSRKRLLFIALVLLVAPLVINVGLMFTDFIYDKTGFTLTAYGLNNENWLEFWKDYMSVAIAFLSIYLVWDSSNKDRKMQIYKDSSDQYLKKVGEEEKTLVEISQCFNVGIVYKALRCLNNTSVRDSKMILLESRDKIDEAHVKFELLTDLSDDFERCKSCKYNPCTDKRIKRELRDMFYDIEKHYIDMLNAGDDYINKIAEEQNNQETINIYAKLINGLKQQISFMQKNSPNIEEINRLQQELAETEQQFQCLNNAKLNQKTMEQMMEPIYKEIDYLSKNMRPMFNRYCKSYIDLRKRHALELRTDGVEKHVKENNVSKS